MISVTYHALLSLLQTINQDRRDCVGQEIEKVQENDIWVDCYSIKISKQVGRNEHEKWTRMQILKGAVGR